MTDEKYVPPARCPWCGGHARVRAFTGGDCVECDRCHASGPMTMFGGRAAITAWNKMASRVAAVTPRDNEGAENGRSCTADGARGPESDIKGAKSQIRCGPADPVNSPDWYTFGGVETIDKVETVVAGLPSVPAFLLGQVVRYVDRAGRKDEAAIDLGKANNYAHRLVRGKWRDR